jgi:hypothetical protein
MNTRKRITLGIGLPISLLAVGAQAAAAGASLAPDVMADAAASPAAFPPPSGAIPADWAVLVDDTQTIAMAVPSTWTHVDTVPARNNDGTPGPWLSATTDQNLMFPLEGVADTYAAAGAVYHAIPYRGDTAAMLAASEYHGVCTAEPVQTFTNGTFTGHIQAFNGCGGTASRIVQVAAAPSDASFTALVLIQLTGQPDDAATLNGVLLSLGRHVPAG